jgi:hypothetical protein
VPARTGACKGSSGSEGCATNSFRVATKILREELDRSLHGPIIDEIKALLQGFDEASVLAVQRSANGFAQSVSERRLC